MKYLLDTCVISDFFKKDPSTILHFKKIQPSDICISSITVMEIEYGLNINEERAVKIRPPWNALLREIAIIPFDENEAICTSLLRAQLKSQPIGAYDCLIAGTALANKLCIVTSNMREFNRLSELIVIENWRFA